MKYVWIIIGCLAVSLGVLGVFLPILPTTPFILLALFCFAKGSERMHRWLLSTQLYKKHVKQFNETRSMTLKSKILILSFASALLISGFYFSPSIYARVIIAVLICIKYYVFIFKIKTAPEPQQEEQRVSDTSMESDKN